MRVRVAWTPAAGRAHEREVEVAAGACLADALQAAGLPVRDAEAAGIWGRVRPLDTPLAEGDRVELYRPLPRDPREVRRERVREKRAVRAGARRRRK